MKLSMNGTNVCQLAFTPEAGILSTRFNLGSLNAQLFRMLEMKIKVVKNR